MNGLKIFFGTIFLFLIWPKVSLANKDGSRNFGVHCVNSADQSQLNFITEFVEFVGGVWSYRLQSQSGVANGTSAELSLPMGSKCHFSPPQNSLFRARCMDSEKRLTYKEESSQALPVTYYPELVTAFDNSNYRNIVVDEHYGLSVQVGSNNYLVSRDKKTPSPWNEDRIFEFKRDNQSVKCSIEIIKYIEEISAN